MPGPRITVVQGTSSQTVLPVTDADGEPLDLSLLAGASAVMEVRQDPATPIDVIKLTTADDPKQLFFHADDSALEVDLLPQDTSFLVLGEYFYQVVITLSDGTVTALVQWTPFDIVLGGSATVPPPPFPNTVKVDENFGLPGDLAYFTPGGTPIQGAQVRVYLKSDYDAGNLANPVGFTSTNAAGGFTNAILVLPGFDYTIRYEQPGSWGPDVKTITA